MRLEDCIGCWLLAPAGSRKLNGSIDHWNPKSWTGDTTTENVNIADCWAEGAALAAVILRQDDLFDRADVSWLEIVRDRGGRVNMLHPRGSAEGMLPMPQRSSALCFRFLICK